jgi:hypothetical protein
MTLGFMVCRLQRPPGQLESAMQELGIHPALILNETSYYTPADETAIADELHRRDLANLEAQHRRQQRP